MTPGPTYVVRCPLCGHLGRYDTNNSGNTFGAAYYSDGKVVEPMLPEVPEVVVCSGCSGAYWLNQADEVARYSRYHPKTEGLDPTWAAAAWLTEPDEAGYLKWFDRLLAANPKRERDLRLFVWWRGNDRHRAVQSTGKTGRAGYLKWLDRLLAWNQERKGDLGIFGWWRGNDRHRDVKSVGKTGQTDPAIARAANMRALLPLLSSGDGSDTLMQAEILRQLGEFDRALAVLSAPLPGDFSMPVQRLRSLCEAGDRQLHELT